MASSWVRTLADGGRLVLRAEYGGGTLWTEDGGYVDVAGLGLPPELVERLEAWSSRFEATLDQEYPPWSGFEDEQQLESFDREGVELVPALMAELPGTIVTYRSSAGVRSRP